MSFSESRYFLAGIFVLFFVFAVKGQVFAGREIMKLSGQWELQPGEEKPDKFTYTVQVPGLVDLSKPSLDPKSGSYFWYKKTFTLKGAQKKRRAFVKIEQSQFGTDVYLNGKLLGGYKGCYTSHEYDASAALNYEGENILLVRVGAKETLKEGESAVGIDWERISWLPGIWGDVWLYFTGDVKISLVQVIPKIDSSSVVLRITLKNTGNSSMSGKAAIRILEKVSAKKSGESAVEYNMGPGAEQVLEKEVKISGMKLWSPETPFLYEASVSLEGAAADSYKTAFGMREFKIVKKHFYLNGKRIILKGSNIAFHRFLSDSDRKGLVWDETWIKKALIDIPKAHNFNFFRNHIGQMYNRWYDIADEYGMLLQDEWPFWSWPNGSKDVIRAEFTQWVKDNYNHPSIIIWDCLNEANYDKPDRLPMIDFVRHDLVSEMKKLDPTRPWEPTDFEEIHPYIYSCHSVLGIQETGGLGFINSIEKCATPVVLNEYLWFWIDKNGNPSNLTKEVAPRWLGRNATSRQLLDFQAFLAQELTELWRRMDADEIAPFVYISVNEGATSHWFNGDIKDLNPKPILAALKNIFAPISVSVELWDRHFYSGEKRKVNVFMFNDNDSSRKCRLICKIVDGNGNPALPDVERVIQIPANGRIIENVELVMPSKPGAYSIEAGLSEVGGKDKPSFSRKAAYVFDEPSPSKDITGLKVMVFDAAGEISGYLKSKGLKILPYDAGTLSNSDILIIGEGGLLDPEYKKNIEAISKFVKNGNTLIVMEQSGGIKGKQDVPVCDEISILFEPQPWRGGESYIFMENPSAPVWKNIGQDHLKMFNGGWGGEAVSPCDVFAPLPYKVEAVCGADLRIPAVLEMPCGKGLVVLSRLQLNGRLMKGQSGSDLIFARRADPVMQQYLLNLLSAYNPASRNAKALAEELSKKMVVIRKAEVSSTEANNGPYGAIDGDAQTRWSSQYSDPQWIKFDLGRSEDIFGIKLSWERACAKEYQIQVSEDSKAWRTVFNTRSGNGGDEFIKTDPPVKGRYVRMYGVKRATEWGYSLWEAKIYINKNDLPGDKPLVSDEIINAIKPSGATASSVERDDCPAGAAVDGDIQTRWSSMSDSDEQWIALDFGKPVSISKVKLSWETAFAGEYEIQASSDGEEWDTVYGTKAGKGGIEEIVLRKPVKKRHLRVLCLKRGSPYGYSLWEIEASGQ
ncbi:MAG: discoidin domain-containing protein [Elusimicrobiota bacterium]